MGRWADNGNSGGGAETKMSLKLINPTGMGVRNDSEGSGYFGAGRGNRLHAGVDFECVPGQEVVSPITGVFVRISYPYADNFEFVGAVLRNKSITIKMWYFQPMGNFRPGHRLIAGECIGIAQDISQRYSDKMTPHIHLQIERVDPLLLMEG